MARTRDTYTQAEEALAVLGNCTAQQAHERLEARGFELIDFCGQIELVPLSFNERQTDQLALAV